MANIENDNPQDDVRAALAQLQDATPSEQQHDAAEGAPPPVDQTPPAERRQPSSYNDQWRRDNGLERQPAERPRDDKGRFARASQEEAARADVVRSIAQLEGKEPAPEIQTEPEFDPNKPPGRWPAAAKAMWSQLPPPIRETVARQLAADEHNMATGVERLKAQHAAAIQGFEEAFAPLRGTYAQHGYKSDVDALRALASAQMALQHDPANSLIYMIRNAPPQVQTQIAQAFGINGGQAPQQYQTWQPQPDHRAIVREEIGLAAANAEIEEFAANPDYPHFHQVRGLMSQLLQGSHCRTLEEAYTAAVMADPQLRAEHFAQLEARDANNRRRSVETKRRAASASLSGAPHGAVAPAKYQNGKATNHHDDAILDVRAAIASLT